jgi:UDP-glucose 4-epimerase
MSKCLVLGANGFIGSHLVDALVAGGHTVRAFDRFHNDETNFFSSKKVEIVAGDFLNRDGLSKSLEGIDYVFHFISTTTPITSENDPLVDIETNIRMSVQLFEECVSAGVKKVIFASTGGAIYGDNSSEHVTEDVLPLPVSPYAIGKLSIEHYLRYFAKKRGLDSVIFRISNPYGERQSLNAKQGVIPIFLQHIYRDEPITVLGDGSMIRDYIYVKDVAQLIVSSFASATQPVYNLGSGQGVSVNELVTTIQKIVPHNLQVEHKENLTTFVDKIVLDTTRFTTEFGNIKALSLEEGIRNTWQYVIDALHTPK